MDTLETYQAPSRLPVFEIALATAGIDACARLEIMGRPNYWGSTRPVEAPRLRLGGAIGR
jgi:hypothetical protein